MRSTVSSNKKAPCGASVSGGLRGGGAQRAPRPDSTQRVCQLLGHLVVKAHQQVGRLGCRRRFQDAGQAGALRIGGHVAVALGQAGQGGVPQAVGAQHVPGVVDLVTLEGVFEAFAVDLGFFGEMVERAGADGAHDAGNLLGVLVHGIVDGHGGLLMGNEREPRGRLGHRLVGRWTDAGNRDRTARRRQGPVRENKKATPEDGFPRDSGGGV